MRKERGDQPFTRYEEICRETYQQLHDLPYNTGGHFNTAEGESLRVCGWNDPRQMNHGYYRSAYGISMQILGKSRDLKQERVHVRSIRIEIVHDYYHYKDTRFHYVARELMPKKSIFGVTKYKWIEIPENVAYLKDNWFTELRQKIKSFKRD